MVAAQAPAIELGDEYTEHSKKPRRTSRSAPANKSSGVKKALLYLPNRLLDLLDIFRFDVGVGPGFGAVVRVTKWGQAGYRDLEPASLRLGLRGRRLPVFVERSAEFGIGPTFLSSADREVSPVEVGAGADLLLVGVYAGVCIDEVLDFLGGIVGFDMKDDDIT